MLSSHRTIFFLNQLQKLQELSRIFLIQRLKSHYFTDYKNVFIMLMIFFFSLDEACFGMTISLLSQFFLPTESHISSTQDPSHIIIPYLPKSICFVIRYNCVSPCFNLFHHTSIASCGFLSLLRFVVEILACFSCNKFSHYCLTC